MKRIVCTVFLMTMAFSSISLSQQWTSSYNSGGKSIDESATVTAQNGNTYVAGSVFSDASGWNMVLLSLTDTGDTSWVHSYATSADEKAVSAHVSQDGSINVTGHGMGETKHWRALLLKFGSDGTLLWLKTYSTGPQEHCRTAGSVLMDNGNIAVALATVSDSGLQGTAIAVFDSSGTVAWEDRYSNANGSVPSSIFSSGGRIAVIGTAWNESDADGLLLLYEQNGTVVSKTVHDGGNGKDEHFQSAALDQSGNVIAVGWEDYDSTSSGILVARFNNTASLDWTYTVVPGSAGGNYRAIHVDVSGTGKIAVSGRVFSTGSGWDVQTIVLNPDGSEDWSKTYAGPGTGTDVSIPLFAGASAAYGTGSSSAVVHWLPARDDVSMADELSYEVFVADSSGGQDFNSPLHTVRGATTAYLTGLVSGKTSYVVVRTLDEAGNSDTNVRELAFTAAAPLVVESDTSLPGGDYWFSSLVVKEGATLMFTGEANLHVTDSILVDGRIRTECFDLNFYRYARLIVPGTIDTRCAGAREGGSLLFFSENGHFNTASRSVSEGIFSGGGIRMTDDTTYTNQGISLPSYARSKMPMKPVGNIHADVHDAWIFKGDTAFIQFAVSGLDPDGGPVTFDIDFGDGTGQTNIEQDRFNRLNFQKGYSDSGTYTVAMTIRDDEGETVDVHLQLHIAAIDSIQVEGIGVSARTFTLLSPVGDTLDFMMSHGVRPLAHMDSIRWDFGDGGNSALETPFHSYLSPGRYRVELHVQDDSGHTASADLYVYVYEPDTTAGRAGKNSDSHNAMPVPTTWEHIGNQEADSDDDITYEFGDRNIIVEGDLTHDQSTEARQNGGVVNIQVNSGVSRIGEIVVGKPGDMLSIIAGNGGDEVGWGTNGWRYEGLGGNISMRAAKITIHGAEFRAGNGGDAMSVQVYIPNAKKKVHASAPCGAPAGTICVQSDKLICTAATTFKCGNGGGGGHAEALAGTGESTCNTGEQGGDASAEAGNGARVSFLQFPRRIVGADFVKIIPGKGGAGGNATAIGGRGGDALNCNNSATGGAGGNAYATAGKGGEAGIERGTRFRIEGAFESGKGGDATIEPGRGGNARALPEPPIGDPGCPGARGMNVIAVGGDCGPEREGRRGTSYNYARNGDHGVLHGTGILGEFGSITVELHNGGDAEATGGIGGDGTGCNCDGGPGGTATARCGKIAGYEYESFGQVIPTEILLDDGGDAIAKGGTGGEGGDCCTPPGPVGGTGGKGSDANALADAQSGVYFSVAGRGGEGGDGFGPGPGGPHGTATAAGSTGWRSDSTKGPDGIWCFPTVITEMYKIDLEQLPNGIQTPGVKLLFPVTKSGNPVGSIEGQFENWAFKTPNGIDMGPGSGFSIDPKSFTIPGGTWPGYYPGAVRIEAENYTPPGQKCVKISGDHNGSECESAEGQNAGGPGSKETIEITAPGQQGQDCDRFDWIKIETGCDALLKPKIEIDVKHKE